MIVTLPPPLPPRAGVSAARASDVYERMTQEVIREAALAASPELQSRISEIIMARLKDLRDYLETAEALTREVAAGGAGLKPTDAKRVLDPLEARLGALTAELGRLQRERKPEKSPPRPAPAPASAEPPSSPPAGDFRPRVRDVKPPASRLVGPLEELSDLSLADFRKLSRNPAEAALKIRDKILLYGEENAERRAAAATAWQQSEPARRYREAISAALGAKRPVRDLLAEQSKTAPGGLTPEEFSAIMELHSLLRS